MLRITLHDSSKATTLKLEGKLAGPWVRELEECWLTAVSASGGRPMIMDLTEVSFIDEEGRELLARMHARGVEMLASTPLNRAIVDRISLGRTIGSLALVALLLWLPAARAQSPEPPVRLTLAEAVGMALRQSPQVQIASLNLAQSQQDVAIARSGLLPEAGLRAYEQDQRFNLQALIGGSFPGAPQHAGPFATFQGGAVFSAPLFDLTLWRRWRASKEVVSATAAQQQTIREQLASLVISQYLGTLRAAADIQAAQSRVDLAQALYDQAADLQKNGVGTGIDTLRANVELQNERQRLITARTALETSIFSLARLLNIDPARQIELTDQVSFFETPPIDLDHSLAAAYANRPELRAIQAQQRAVEFQRQAAGAARYPTLRFDGNWGYQALTAPWNGIPAYTFGGTVQFPLFTGGRIAAERARADLELQKSRQQEQDTRNLVALQVRTAAAQMEAARSEVDVANLGANLARQEVDQARDRFRAGVANNIEVISAQDALARAGDNQIAALYRYNQARADLARAAGQAQALYAK
jgi:outer membrane protein TolC